VIAEDLVAREPWEHAHIDRFRRALVVLGVPDPDALIADRLSGQGPFVATDPFMAPESFGEPEAPILRPFDAEPPAPVREPETPAQPEPPPEREPEPATPPVHEPPPGPPPRRDPEPDIPLRRRSEPAAPQPPPGGTGTPAGADVDLNGVLSALHGMEETAAPTVHRNLDEVFDARRTEASRQAGMQEAAEQLALGKTYIRMRMHDEAITSLASAARIPTHRFEAASLLGRLYLKRDDRGHAIEWLERAAQAPAPTAEAGRELLYDLGATLDESGEVARALAVFLELQAEAGDYRDVAARVERLARVQTGG
jgi:hypothetical protein